MIPIADDEVAVRCDCGCTILIFERWNFEGEPPGDVNLDIFTTIRGASFLYRLKTAWRVLRGKDPYLDALVLQEPAIRELAEWLQKQIVQTEARRYESDLRELAKT